MLRWQKLSRPTERTATEQFDSSRGRSGSAPVAGADGGSQADGAIADLLLEFHDSSGPETVFPIRAPDKLPPPPPKITGQKLPPPQADPGARPRSKRLYAAPVYAKTAPPKRMDLDLSAAGTHGPKHHASQPKLAGEEREGPENGNVHKKGGLADVRVILHSTK